MESKRRRTCCAAGCGSKNTENLTLFLINSAVRPLWMQMLRVPERKRNFARLHVCEKHFERKFIKVSATRKILDKDAIPTLGLLPEGEPAASTSTIPVNASEDQEPLDHVIEESKCTLKLLAHNISEEEDEELIKQIEFIPKPVHTKQKLKRKYTNSFKLFALKLYFSSPFSYRALQSVFGLPRLSTLYRLCIPTTTELSTNVITTLAMKVNSMTMEQKQCVVCLGTTKLVPEANYDVVEDKMNGFHEVDGLPELEYARIAVLVMVRGLFHNWKQPLAYALLSNAQKCDNVNRVIEVIIIKLFALGLNVRALMTDIETEQYTKLKIFIDDRNPYTMIGSHKIFYIYDTLHLMNNIRYHFMTHKFVFSNTAAALWPHLNCCYHKDQNYDIRIAPSLSPNLLSSKVGTPKEELDKSRQLFDVSIATALSVRVKGAMNTAQFILNMHKLMEMFNFSTIHPAHSKEAVFTGSTPQIQFLHTTLKIFRTIKFTCLETNQTMSEQPPYVKAIMGTITAIVKLCETMKSEQCWYPIVGLSRDCLEEFFHKVDEHTEHQTTAKDLINCMTKFPIFNIFSYHCKKRRSNDLDTFMVIAKQVPDYDKYETSRAVVQEFETEEFKNMELRTEKRLEQVALYFLYKGYQHHTDCVDMYLYCAGFLKYNVPELIKSDSTTDFEEMLDSVPLNFIQFVRMLEVKFQELFQGKNFARPLTSLETLTRDVTFDMPCACFPIHYIKSIYMRYRLYTVFEFNSEPNNSDIEFVINDL